MPKEVKWIATDPGDLEIWFKDEPYSESLLGWVGDEYSSYFIDEKVTHWMPLPEPPKEEKEEG